MVISWNISTIRGKMLKQYVVVVEIFFDTCKLSIVIIDFLLSKKITLKYSLKIIWKKILQMFLWNIFSMSYSEQNETKELSCLESQLPIYVGMCTQNYKTYKKTYLTVDSFNLLNYFAWKTLPFFISHSNMAKESFTESDKENIKAIINHSNKWIRLTFPSFGSDHPSVFPLRLLQGDSIFNMSFLWVVLHFHFFVFNSISLSLFIVSNSSTLSLLTADSRVLSLFPRWFKNMKEQLSFDLDDFSQEVQRGRVGGHFYHINIISPHAIPFFVWLDQSFYLFC